MRLPLDQNFPTLKVSDAEMATAVLPDVGPDVNES